MTVRDACVALVVALAGCGGASFPTYRSFAPSDAPHLAGSSSSPNVSALAERFYRNAALRPDVLGPEIEALLRRHPHRAVLHEMAAHLAVLSEDTHAAFRHWLAAAADLDSDLTPLYLEMGLRVNLTASEQAAAIQLLEALRGQHPRPDVRIDASRRLVHLYQLRERLEDADRIASTLPMIRDFRVLGVFDNDQGRGFHAAYPPEGGAAFDAEVQGLRLPVCWREADAIDRTGLVRLSDMLSPARWAVAYLFTSVRADEARDAQLRITTPAPVRAWVNGRLVASHERLHRGSTDNVVVPIRLQAGENEVLIKSAQDGDGVWVLGARVSDMDGAPLPGVRYSRGGSELRAVEATPEEGSQRPPRSQSPRSQSPRSQSPRRQSPRRQLPGSQSPIELALSNVEPALRRQLLTHHESVRGGYMGDALVQARRLLEQAPQNPLVVLYAADTHWSNEELGRTIDLLNQGVDMTEGWGGGFLLRRGTFYRSRERFDRSLFDLRQAVELNERSRLSPMALADTLRAQRWLEQECAVLRDVVRRWPDSGWALRALGFCQQSRGYLQRAEESYLRADGVEPGHEWSLERLSMMARSRWQYDRSLQMIDRLVALYPYSGSARLKAGDAYRLAGRRDDAREHYLAAQRRDPQWAEPQQRLGLMAIEEQNVDEAIAAWTLAVERDPENAALSERLDYLREGGAESTDPLVPSESDIERALASAGALSIDPGAHTALLLDDEVTAVARDGSATRHVTQVTLAVTTDGRDALIQNRVPSSARIRRAFAVNARGQRQEASSIRGGVIRFRGLEVGSSVVMQYTHRAAPPAFLPNHFVSTWLFQGLHQQVRHARWVIRLPPGRALAWHVRGPVAHREEVGPHGAVHTFTAQNTPPLVSEPRMPPLQDLLATVHVSTLTRWEDYAQWERALLTEVFEGNERLSALARTLTAEVSTPRERFDRLYHYVAQEIRYQQDYEDTIAGVRPHSCPVVLERGYGDCKDKAVLLILLAREVGLDVRFAILRTTPAGAVIRDVPNQQFNHAIVYVPAQDGIESPFFMDPTTDGMDIGSLRVDDQGALAMVLDPRDGSFEFREIPYQSPDRQFFGCDVAVRVRGPAGAEAEATCRAVGQSGSTFRQVMRNRERANQLRQNMATSIFPGSQVRSSDQRHVDDIWQPLEIDLTLDAGDAIQAAGSNRRLQVPMPFLLGQLTRLEQRRTPLRLGPADSAAWKLDFELPRGGRFVQTPESFRLQHRCFTVERITRVRGLRATVQTTYERTCPEVGVDEYPEFRRLAQQAATRLRGDVVFAL